MANITIQNLTPAEGDTDNKVLISNKNGVTFSEQLVNLSFINPNEVKSFDLDSVNSILIQAKSAL